MGFWRSDKGNSPQESASTSGGAPPPPPSDSLPCTFCGRRHGEVELLIATDAAAFCCECIEQSHAALRAERASKLPGPQPIETILTALGAIVVGQERAKRAIGAALWVHLRHAQRSSTPPGPRRVLLVGPPGIGKTSLLRAAALVEPHLPSYVAAASRITESGYVGEDIESLLWGLLDASGQSEAAFKGLLVLDGLHHLAQRHPVASHYRDISGAEVQRELVRLLDGALAEVSAPARHPQKPTTRFPCDRLLVLAAATVRLPEGEPMGPRELHNYLAEQGFLEEMLSRFDLIVPMKPLSARELGEVAQHFVAPLPALFSELGSSLWGTEEGIAALAEYAAAAPEGAWALQRPFARLTEEALMNPGQRFTLNEALAKQLLEQ